MAGGAKKLLAEEKQREEEEEESREEKRKKEEFIKGKIVELENSIAQQNFESRTRKTRPRKLQTK